MKAGHIHTPEDGRGPRDVFVDGKQIYRVFFADTKRGIVRAYMQPLRLDKWRKRALSETLRGVVEVRATEGHNAEVSRGAQAQAKTNED